jgi:hypothetical protein
MKHIISFFIFFSSILSTTVAQERVVKVDFESGSFVNSPSVPYDKPFLVEGEVLQNVEYVEVAIFPSGSETELHRYSWNRYDQNQTETFSIKVPAVLKSNSKYDFKVITYKRLMPTQKEKLRKNLKDRVRFYLENNYKFDGKRVSVEKPKHVYRGLEKLIDKALEYQVSKNGLKYSAPSNLVLNELENDRDFKFRKFLSRKKTTMRDSIANKLIDKKVNHLTDLVMSEVNQFLNSDLVQQYRTVKVEAVPTDKERFSLPVNAGMYAWNKSTTIDNASVNNTNFTPGVGFTIPFAAKTTLAQKAKLFDSFGYSMGVLFDPVRDASGTEFVTPGVNIPVYTGFGIRLFKVVRLNVGGLILAEDGIQDFQKITFLPTAGLALELNLWMGVKK